MKRTRSRMDGVSETVTKDVEVSRIVEPRFLTLTKMPAGQVAFKVVRDDKGEEPNMAGKAAVPTPETRHRRIRSTQRSSLLYIEFPEGTTAEDVESAIEDYGLEGYDIVQEGDKFCLRRSDLSETPSDALTVLIGSGRKAGIVRADATAAYAVQDPMPHVAVIAIDFKKDSFPNEDAVLQYLQRYDIDFLEKGVENADTLFHVLRSEVSADTEVRRVEIEPGVVALVTRAAVADLVNATPFIEVVSETAYGQWGWGQLDFSARMADIEFCEAAEEATCCLRRVVEDVLFYSQLPVAVRKELVTRATTQFSAYIGSLLDALPAKVILINRSNLEKMKEHSMPTKIEKPNEAAGDTTAARTDDDAAKTAAAAEQAAKDAALPVTRAEAKAMIGEAVAAAVAALTPAKVEPTQRTDSAAPAPAEVENGESKTLKAVEEVVTRSMAGIAGTVQAVADRLTALEGATTMRSDSGDGATEPPKKDPFVGIFSPTQAK